MDRVWHILARFAVMTRFFTRLPVQRFGPLDTPDLAPDFVAGAWLLPLVGVLASLPSLLVAVTGVLLKLPFPVIALLAALVAVLTTGALHEDGLADIADGFGGGHTAERKLDIMKDSRVGAFGVIALILVIALRVACWSAILRHDHLAGFTCALMGAAALSRAAMLVPFTVLPNARGEGLAASLRPPGADGLAKSLAAGLVVVLLVDLAFAPAMAMIFPVLLALLAAACITWLAKRQIGGHTGDVIGATQQVAEIAFLVGVLL